MVAVWGVVKSGRPSCRLIRTCPDRIAFMLADSGVTLGITAESTLAGLPEGRWLTVADLLGAQVSGEAVLADIGARSAAR